MAKTMFMLAMPETVKWPVTINVPTDGGVTTPEQITVEYRYLDTEQLDQAVRESGNDVAFLRRVVMGWEGIGDADGNALACSAESLGQVCRHAFVKNALIAGIYQMVSGARAKN